MIQNSFYFLKDVSRIHQVIFFVLILNKNKTLV